MQTLINYIKNFILQHFTRMSKEFIINDTRRVIVKKEAGEYVITIEEVDSELKTLTFPERRFAQLMAFEFLIEQAVNSLLVKQNVGLKVHLGGGFFVSVTSGFDCVDLREFYFNKTKGFPCPTKRGISLRLTEWTRLKEVFQEIKQKFPALTKVESCSIRADHLTLEGFLSCAECQLFRREEELFSQKFQM